MLGIVACESLYEELGRSAPEATVAYVPQWLHEYPIHPPESSAIRRAVQTQVTALEDQGVDEILLLYHDPEGIAGVRSARVPLHVYGGWDCIDLFLPDGSLNRYGERKDPNTYYLTRGWIDVGLDCYKVYRAYAGTVGPLIDEFREAQRRHPGLRVTWPTCDRIRRARDLSGRIQSEPEALLRSVVGCFSRVVLVDTGAILPIHESYARSFREFVADVGSEGPMVPRVALERVEGDRTTLETLVTDPGGGPDVQTVPPGRAVDRGATGPASPTGD